MFFCLFICLFVCFISINSFFLFIYSFVLWIKFGYFASFAVICCINPFVSQCVGPSVLSCLIFFILSHLTASHTTLSNPIIFNLISSPLTLSYFILSYPFRSFSSRKDRSERNSVCIFLCVQCTGHYRSYVLTTYLISACRLNVI